MTLDEHPDREMLMLSLADRLAGELGAALRRRDRASLAVPGGSTPGPLFDALAAVDLDWARVDVVPTDERWVDETSPRSNARLIRERLLTGRAANASLVPLHAGGAQPEGRLDGVAARVGALMPLSVLLLGMGADGSIASLVPGAEGLEAALAPGAPAVVPLRLEDRGEPRVNLSARVLRGALSAHLLITGAEKRATAERAARARDPRTMPAALIVNEATVHWAE